jgi:hypothetical protein
MLKLTCTHLYRVPECRVVRLENTFFFPLVNIIKAQHLDSLQISSFQNVKSHTTLKLTCTHLYSSMLASRDSLPVSSVSYSPQNQRLYIIKIVTDILDFVLFWSFILTLQVILISMLKLTCTHLYRVPECRYKFQVSKM